MAVVENRSAEGEKVVADDRQYLIHSWSVQSALNPLPVAGAEGRYFWDYEGNRYLDFASQLVNVSIGHQHPKVVAAIKEQADTLCTIGPPMANDKRSEAARLIAEVMPGDLERTFFTNGGAEANENAIKLARWVHRAAEDHRALPLLPRRDGGRDHADRRPAALVRRARGARRYDGAIEQGELNLRKTSGANFSRIVLAAAYAQQGRTDDTARIVTTIHRLDPTFDVREFGTKFLNSVDLDLLREGLSKAGLWTDEAGRVVKH